MFDAKYLEWTKKRIRTIIDYYGHEFFYNKTLLDIGCGQGDVGGAFSRLGSKVCFLDVNQQNLNFAIKKFPGTTSINKNIDGQFILPQKYDIILDLNVIPFIKNFEQHIQSVCNYTNNLILDLSVLDSIDPSKVITSQEAKTIYHSYNGFGSRPSQACIEKILSSCKMNYNQLSNKNCNYENYNYNWVNENNDSHDISKRRLFFCVKVDVKQEKPPEVLKKTNIAVIQRPVEQPIPVKLIVSPNKQEPKIYDASSSKVALCLSGNLRTYERCFHTLKQNILDKVKCDIFLAVWDDFNSSPKVIEKLKSLYNPKKLLTLTYQQTKSIFAFKHFPLHLKMFNMFYMIEQCNNLKSEYEKLLDKKYQYVIRSRFDLLYNSPLVMSELDDSHLFVPKYGHYHGINDQFGIGSSEIMDHYAKVFKYSVAYNNNNDWSNGMDKSLGHIYPEIILKRHMEEAGIKFAISSVNYDILRMNGAIYNNRLSELSQGYNRDLIPAF